MNGGVGRAQQAIRTVDPMNWLLPLLRGLGTAGATANARAELTSAHERNLQAAVVAKRVRRSGTPGIPLTPAAEARVA